MKPEYNHTQSGKTMSHLYLEDSCCTTAVHDRFWNGSAKQSASIKQPTRYVQCMTFERVLIKEGRIHEANSI